MRIRRCETDLLIVGSGFAGLWAAIAAREAGVTRIAMVDKGAIAMSSQSRLCAGATIYCLPEDQLELWPRDIVEANGFRERVGSAAVASRCGAARRAVVRNPSDGRVMLGRITAGGTSHGP